MSQLTILLNLISISLFTDSYGIISSVPSLYTVDLPTSCIGLEDGTYLMKLINNDNYPIISVQCSNEYIIIDASIDPNWSLYFTSWIKYHYGVVGPDRNDLVNWNEWFLPSQRNNNNNFLISLDCNTCDITSYIQKYNTLSTFYLSSLAFGCFNPTRGWPSCDMDYNTYKCRICHWNDEQSQIIWKERDFLTLEETEYMGELTGICDFEIRKSIDDVLQSYHECTTYIPTDYNNFKPSIGIDGTHCQCFKPSNNENIENIISVTKDEYDISLNRLESIKNDKNKEEETKNDIKYTSKNHIVHLTQTDFKKGTYRILQSGTYIIDEDITFNFNPSKDANNPLSDDGWWPYIEDIEFYPGAGKSRDAYFLGFFAGITIETDDVILDLNDKELKMSKKFYFSQPFFSIIELSSQPFLPQQGPGFFGSDPKFATNIIIKNGILGLSSHHGIHGNYNSDITISNVIIHDFQTHGIQLNGYNNIIMKDLEIGPSANIAYLNGNYGQLIKLLPTLRKLGNKYKTETITFNGRKNIKYTINDLLNILEPLMIKSFNYAYYKSIDNEIEINKLENDIDYKLILSLFLNPSGLSYGAVTYGIFLNYPSSGIFGWHVNDEQSDGAILDNIYIHDIYRNGIEIIGLAQKGRVYSNAFNGALPIIEMLGDIDKVKEFADALLTDNNEDNNNDDNIVYAQYVGSIVTDIHIAMYEFGRDSFNNWPGIPYYGEKEGLLLWAKGENNKYLSSNNNDIISIYCNNDAMFHPSKGLLGIKISGSKNIQLNGIHIKNLIDFTDFGQDLCGKKDLYHFSQQKPYQIGFCMNMVHGISIDFSDVIINNKGIKIDGIYSKTGLTFAISTWFDTKINYKSSPIDIYNIYAGFDNINLNNDHILTYQDRPNKASEACAIRIYSSQEYKVINIFDNDNKNNINIKCINGDVGCYGDINGIYTNLGYVEEEKDDNNCQQRPILLLKKKQKKKESTTPYLSDIDTSPIFYGLIGFIILICLFISKKIYHDYPIKKILNTDFKYDLINTKDQDDDDTYGTF